MTEEYKQGLYYKHLREWTSNMGISCFYFEAFNEKWKDAHNQKGSENHFGLFKINGEAKYPIWDLVDKGIFKGLKRNGNTITKTYNGNMAALGLSDDEVADVMNYITNSWGNKNDKMITEEEVSEIKK